MSYNQIVCLGDLEKHASRVLPKMAWDYYSSGANGEVTLTENTNAFQTYQIYPHILRSVGTPSLFTSVQGHSISMPICIAPTAFHCMAHPQGEKATARAAASAGICMCLSTLSNTALEDVAAIGNGLRWFQLYIHTDRQATLQLVRRAEKCGYKAIALTVDAPLLGNRYADEKNDFSIPSHLKCPHLVNLDKIKVKTGSKLSMYFATLLENNSSWEVVHWLKSITSLPIIIKGIHRGEDALLAVEHGADGIWVSNHGARQLDSVPASIDMLYEIVQYVDPDKVEIYFDGGVRYGTDVLIALALGARSVFVGRPAIWGLSYGGEEGVTLMLELLRKELILALTLSGCKDVHSLPKGIVKRKSYLSKL
ncbi:Hydroxyacid oxidase 1-like [Oopsacas minuta]|uniref:(S)-2-hydroxy-acid oxidase n=1 Tax=Oopsacas minuta TaxID=111878 RepID=A0AAV7JCZ6_9METZ|nr:Hydroxyacid oxidase 1-like [Oopsacas minuta]